MQYIPVFLDVTTAANFGELFYVIYVFFGSLLGKV